MKALSARPAPGQRTAVVGDSPPPSWSGPRAVALLGGCGFETRQQAAAVVNGEVIRSPTCRRPYEQLQRGQVRLHRERRRSPPSSRRPCSRTPSRRRAAGSPTRPTRQVIAAIPDATEHDEGLHRRRRAHPVADDDAGPDRGLPRPTSRRPTSRSTPASARSCRSEQGPVYFTIGQSTPNWIKPWHPTAAAPAA